MSPLFNAAFILAGRHQDTYGIVINPHPHAESQYDNQLNAKNNWLASHIMCVYPRNSDSDWRKTKHGDNCPCGAIIPKDGPDNCQILTKMPTQISKPHDFDKYFIKHCGFLSTDPSCDYPSLPGNQLGFNTVVQASQNFNALGPCKATAGDNGNTCNETCSTQDGHTNCITWNEVDIDSQHWKDFLTLGKHYADDGENAAISALFVVCSDNATSTYPCTTATLKKVQQNIQSIWGQHASYPILQDKIPVFLLNLDQLTKTEQTSTQAPDTGPFICPSK